jgi:hypothetical protein
MRERDTPFNTCMLSNKNDRDQSIACCFNQCNTKDLKCQEQCIEDFNKGIAEPFALPHFGKLGTLAVLNVVVWWLLFTNLDKLPRDRTVLFLIIVLIQFALYHVVKKKY